MNTTLRSQLFEILEGTSVGDWQSRLFGTSISTLICLNIVAVVLQTVPSLSCKYAFLWRPFEVFSVAVFTAEYALRLLSCTASLRFRHPIRGRIRFAVTPLALVDLLAIVPFYLPMAIPADLRFLRALRLFRVFRIFKMARYSRSLQILVRVLGQKRQELVITAFAVLVLLVATSSLMYFIENAAQPKAFRSIPMAMWWSITTLTTVAYGDVYPVTAVGRLLGSVVALLGIGLFALPAGVLASGFVEEIQQNRTKQIICPHCGKPVH